VLRRLTLLALAVSTVVALSAPGAQASGFPIYSGFHSVLAFGEGEGTSAGDLAAYEAASTAPAVDLSQDSLYEGLEQAWPGFTSADLNTYYKNSGFQSQPSASALSTLLGGAGSTATGEPGAVETPEAGVTIVREPPYEVPRIYADTRAEGMWAAGYVTAEDRLFFLDVLRHTAEGTTAQLLGSSAVSADSKQLGLQDATPAQLTGAMDSLPRTMGAEGSQTLSDINNYVGGINAFID
jgi:hypothetical protein